LSVVWPNHATATDHRMRLKNDLPKPGLKLKILLWSMYLALIVTVSTALILAPSLGLGQQGDFVLYRYVGIPRGMALQLLLWPGVFAALYEILALGIGPTVGRPRILAVMRSAWADGSIMTRDLFCPKATPTRRERWIAIGLAAAVTLLFVLFLSKSLFLFLLLPEQHWSQALLDYGIDWRTPIFAFGGNLLYSFGMQFPLKGQLLPMEGTAHFFPIQFRIAATVVLCFLAAGLLFWCIGVAIGLKLAYRIVFAGLSALITTMPVGLSYVIWVLPPLFITYNFIAGVWSTETSILCLIAAFLFFFVGTQSSFSRNFAACIGFALGASAPILVYPYVAVYLVPVLALYCLAFILTCETQKEFYWKASLSALLVAAMLAARVPQFIADLYSYSFGAYFLEFSTEPLPSFTFNSIATVFIFYLNDPRGLLSLVIALAALAIAASAGKGALRRIAVAALVCEATIIAASTLNLWWWRIPLRGDYAELAHAPILAAYLVLAIIVVAKLLDRRVVEWGSLSSSKYSPAIRWIIRSRGWSYGSLVVFMIAVYWLLQTRPASLADYPPKAHPSVELLRRELALAPGMQFRGRLMTLLPGTLDGPADPPMFYDILNEYRRYLGSDVWVDPLAFNIPMLNELGHFSTPLTFAFARTFFGREGDAFDRTTIVFTRFDLRIARLAGVRMVATDAPTVPGGILLYETKAGSTDLRLFRIEDVNLGQYSPTRPRYVRTGADAIAAIKAVDFDPKVDVVVEREIAGNLVPAHSALVTVDRGPTLIVRAASSSRSLLVLPFEYSHCLELDVAGGRAQLLPVNLQQTGLLFDNEVEARITYRFGLFHNSRCRAEDHRRADDLKLKEALIFNNRVTFTRERPKLW
jgi:hypothetical protein